MEPGTTTIKVYVEDKEAMEKLFGGPTHKAFRKVMATTAPNPELAAEFLAAVARWKEKQAVTTDEAETRKRMLPEVVSRVQ